MRDFWVYMLRCSDGHYYVGHTDDIDRRLSQHHQGSYDGYSAARLPVELIWSDRFPDRTQAFAFERRLKSWSRAKKEAFVAGRWDDLKHLAIPPAERETRTSPTNGPTP
jgi:predicted GIY-YIG superfamily endonuclease